MTTSVWWLGEKGKSKVTVAETMSEIMRSSAAWPPLYREAIIPAELLMWKNTRKINGYQ